LRSFDGYNLTQAFYLKPVLADKFIWKPPVTNNLLKINMRFM